MPRFVDLTGKRLYRLVVIRKLDERDKHGVIRWLCRCDCGNERIYTTSILGNKKNIVKSCGCYKRDKMTKGYGEASFNRLCQVFKEGATKRGLEFDLQKDLIKSLIDSPCFYCGKEPSQVYRRSKRYNQEYLYNGIDRIDNTIGYVDGNVLSCCGKCNRMKFKHPFDDFKNHIVSIYNHWASK